MAELNGEAVVALFVFLAANVILLVGGLVKGARALGRMETKIDHANGLGERVANLEGSVKMCQEMHLGADE